MKLIAVDLGSTNLKTAVYDEGLQLCGSLSAPVVYDRQGKTVEFDAEAYCESLLDMLAEHRRSGVLGAEEPCTVCLTGQAETLVVLGENGKPLRPAISWMDERSDLECEELASKVDAATCYRVTGQMAVLPTWPATKVLWLQRNEPETFRRAAHYVLLKDYVVYFLTGKMLADMSIATFSFWFDIYKKQYWQQMLDLCGIRREQLLPLAEPCADAGRLTAEASARCGLKNTSVNLGTLDHFAGMVGTGNIASGGVSLSTGTVMALATMASSAVAGDAGIAMHYGFLPDTHVMLPVAESGGVSLEWFKRACLGEMTYGELNEAILQREMPNSVLFLPYLVGTNAPEFDRDACGVFAGLRAEHDAVDMAYAVMEGVSHLLRRNLESIRKAGTEIKTIIATGGGAKSPVWCQLQADVTGIPVSIPREKEAACLGAAIIAAVSAGVYPSLQAACEKTVTFEKTYQPRENPALEKKYRQFGALYDAALTVMRMNGKDDMP